MKFIKNLIKLIAIVIGVFTLLIIVIGIFTDETKYTNTITKYSTANLNIRKGPGKDFEVIKTLKPNDRILTYDTIANGFTMVLNNDSTKLGWTYSSYLQNTQLSKKQLDKIKYVNNPLKISEEELKSFIGKKTPYDNWSTWGSPETLEDSNTEYWAAYLPKANISIVTDKQSDKVLFIDFGKNKASKYLKDIRNKRSALIKSQFSSWDGSHNTVSKYIKENMHNPDSYEHVKTSYYEKKDHLIIKTTIRGTNAFGGIVTTSYTAEVDLNGNIINIEQS